MPILTEPPAERPHTKFLRDKKVIVFILQIGIVLGTGIAIGFARTSSPSSEQVDLVAPVVSRVDYERMELGMTQAEVEAILNPGIEVSRSKESNRLVWKNPDGSKIEAEFQHGALIYKEQSGLN